MAYAFFFTAMQPSARSRSLHDCHWNSSKNKIFNDTPRYHQLIIYCDVTYSVTITKKRAKFFAIEKNF